MNYELKNNVPVVRFPGFGEAWVVKRLGEIGEIIGGGTPFSSNANYWNGNNPWISSSDIVEGNIQDVNITRFITDEAITKSATKKIPKNCVLIVSRVGVGKFAVSKQEICTSQDFSNFLPKNDDAYFLAYYFNARKNKFLSLSQGTSIKGFTGKDIRNLKFAIPNSLPEQTRIAHFFTTLDKKINQLQQKKSSLEAYKKGMMQQIFSQELRFKDENGEVFPDWEVKKLGEVCERSKGKYNPLKDKANYICVELESIGQNNGTLLKTFNSKNLKSIKNRFQIGEVLFGKLRPNLRKFYFADFDGVCSSEIWVLKGLGTNNIFLYYLIQTESFNYQVSLTTGSKMPRADWGLIRNSKFVIPNSTVEQARIANFLSQLDEKINTVNTQIAQSKTYKKGLLQKMFV